MSLILRAVSNAHAHTLLGKGRLAYLVAFSSLLPLIPSSLCLSDLDRVCLFCISNARSSANRVQLLPLLLRSLSLPYPAQRINTIITLTSVLETANLSASVDTLLHTNSVTLVDALLLSALRNPNVESSGVSYCDSLSFCLARLLNMFRPYARQHSAVWPSFPTLSVSRHCRLRRAE